MENFRKILQQQKELQVKRAKEAEEKKKKQAQEWWLLGFKLSELYTYYF